jgi:tetrahydromethanopterin S-methyltransferase subunit A
LNKASASRAIQNIIEELQSATAAAKCHKCGCFHSALSELTNALPVIPSETREVIQPVIDTGLKHTTPEEYDCIGCRVCWPANALNFAAEAFPDIEFEGDSCPTEVPAREHGWPPLPGDFTVLDSAGQIAVCALTSKGLVERVVEAHPGGIAIVGTLYTENLGIERIITNVLSNPNITTLLICGADSEQRIGHLPGQTFLSLVDHGVDAGGRIINAKGRRPLIKNISHDAIETFRKEIRVLDNIGEEDVGAVVQVLAGMSASSGPRRAPRHTHDGPRVIRAQSVERLELDPKGYFVVFPDRERQCILIEHYVKDGTLAHVLKGERADDLFATVIAHELVSRLDHAAYLGKELARAEQALRTGEPYIQDRAPEPHCCASDGCTESRKKES